MLRMTMMITQMTIKINYVSCPLWAVFVLKFLEGDIRWVYGLSGLAISSSLQKLKKGCTITIIFTIIQISWLKKIGEKIEDLVVDCFCIIGFIVI